jgi:RNA polymerase sigma factor (sigma-70 family)
MSDSSALLQAQRSNDFSTLVRDHHALVYGVCRRILGNVVETEDVVQETFVKLSERMDQIHSHVGAWLHACARSTAIDHLRAREARQRRERGLHGDHAVYGAAHASATVEREEEKRVVDTCLAELADEDRELIIAYYFSRVTQHDLAQRTGITQAAVHKRLERILESLRHMVERRGVMLSVALAALLAEMSADASVPPELERRLLDAEPRVARHVPATRLFGSKLAIFLVAGMGVIAAIWLIHAQGASASSSGAQSWSRMLVHPGYTSRPRDYLYDIAAVSGGVYTIGSTTTADGDMAPANGFVVKWDDRGAIVWQRRLSDYTAPRYSVSPSKMIRVLATGDLLILGSLAHGTLWLAELSPSGEIKRQRQFAVQHAMPPQDVVPTADGGCYVCASAISSDHPAEFSAISPHALIIRFDRDWQVMWQRQVLYSEPHPVGIGQSSSPGSLAVAADGGVVFGGWLDRYQDPVSAYHGFLVRFDRDGGLVWQKYYSAFNYSIHVSAVGDEFVVAGRASDIISPANEEHGPYYGLALARIGRDGGVRWHRTYQDPARLEATPAPPLRLIAQPSGACVLVGLSLVEPRSWWLGSFAADGAPISARRLDDVVARNFIGGMATDGGALYLAGSMLPDLHGEGSQTVVKRFDLGALASGGIPSLDSKASVLEALPGSATIYAFDYVSAVTDVDIRPIDDLSFVATP